MENLRKRDERGWMRKWSKAQPSLEQKAPGRGKVKVPADELDDPSLEPGRRLGSS